MNPFDINIFVYGTLKPGYAAYDRLCAGQTIAEIPAIMPGYLYHLRLGYPAIALEACLETQLDRSPLNQSQPKTTVPKSCVQGYCLTFRDPRILDKLDEYEKHDWEDLLQVCPDHPQGNDYSRVQEKIYTPSGQLFGPAWVYAMTLEQIDRLKGRLIHSGTW